MSCRDPEGEATGPWTAIVARRRAVEGAVDQHCRGRGWMEVRRNRHRWKRGRRMREGCGDGGGRWGEGEKGVR